MDNNAIWDRLKMLKAELYEPSHDDQPETAKIVLQKKSVVPFKKAQKKHIKDTKINHSVKQITAGGEDVAAAAAMDIPTVQSPATDNTYEKQNGSPASVSMSNMFKKLATDALFLKTALKENHNLHKERDEDKRTLLHHISVTGNLECFLLLLETAGKQLDLQPKDVEGNTPLHCSCHYRHSLISEKLIELGCSTFRRNNMRQTPLDCYIGGAKDLLQLCNDADYDRVQELLSNVPTCVNKRDSDGWTALHTCAANGWIKGVDLLLRHGMKATLLDKEGRTSVHLASRFGHGDIIHLLISSTDDLVIDFQSKGKLWTPLMYACFHCQIYAAVVLIKCGANTQLKSMHNKTCFHYMMDDDKKKLLMDLAEAMLQPPQKLLPLSSQGQESNQNRGGGGNGGANNEGGLQARPPMNSPPSTKSSRLRMTALSLHGSPSSNNGHDLNRSSHIEKEQPQPHHLQVQQKQRPTPHHQAQQPQAKSDADAMYLWLYDLKLSEYYPHLVNEGFKLIEDFQGLSKEECFVYFAPHLLGHSEKKHALFSMKQGDILRLIKHIPNISEEMIREYDLKAITR